MDYTKLLEQSPKILSAIFIAGVLFLIAPASVLGSMSLNDFWLRPYIGIVTILAAALLLHGAAYLIDLLKGKRKEKRQLEALTKTLTSLTPSEKRALQPYILENKNSAGFPIASGVVGGLVAKKILYMSANISHGYSFPHNLQPWAREHLTKHPELLEGADSEIEMDDD